MLTARHQAQMARPWLIPLAYALASMFAGTVVPQIEHAWLPVVQTGFSAGSAQAFFSATASGMLSLTAIVFSIGFIMVQYCGTAYSPRLVLWFARDPLMFHALGIFVATFIYSLFTLIWVDRADWQTVPPLSTSVTAFLILVSMVVFARLVHRITELQITNVLHRVGDRGRAVIATFAPDDAVTGPDGPASSHIPLPPAVQVLRHDAPPRSVDWLDLDAMVRLAREADAVIVLDCAVGDTVVLGEVLLRVHGGTAPVDMRAVARALGLGLERTFEQDPKYPLRLLVDIAIKALSPAINDPTTAVQAIDQIEDLLLRLGRCALGPAFARDREGAVRVCYPMPSWDDYLELGFDEIRQYGRGSVQVLRRMRAALAGLEEQLENTNRVLAVQAYLKHLDGVVARSDLDAEDSELAMHADRQGLGLTRTEAFQ